jgi:hypothetical protein
MGPEKDAPERSGTTEGLMAKVGDTRPAEPRSPCQAPLLKTTAQAHRQPALPKRPQPQPHEDAFSTKTCAANKDPAHGRKQAHSARSTPAPMPAHATSTKLQHSALSSRKCPTTPLTKQDEVHGALTPFRLCWGLGPGFGPHAGRVPQRTWQRAEQSRFLAKGRGVIKLPLQQRQVAIRVTRFQRFFLLAACFLMVPAPVTFSNFAATRAG